MDEINTFYEPVKMRDGELIRVAWVEPSAAPKAVIQILHGFAEHIAHYLEVAYYFAENGYACVIHDQRGFGEMPGKTKAQRKACQGIVRDYKSFLDDIETLREKIESHHPNVPVILYGHSMGGTIAASYLMESGRQGFSKAILETPWLRLKKPPSHATEAAARLLGAISPKFATVRKLDPEEIVRDREKTEKLQYDEYYHNRISLRLYTQITDAGKAAISGAACISTPVLLLCAGNDKLVSSEAIREFHSHAGDNIEFKEFPDGFHSLHNDIVSDEVMCDMMYFCECGKKALAQQKVL